MSETEKKPRTIEELQNDFNQLSFLSGKLAYEIAQKEKDLQSYQTAMRDLSIEAAVLNEKLAKEAAEASKTESPKLAAVTS